VVAAECCVRRGEEEDGDSESGKEVEEERVALRS
jgi:hypothetical protein